MLTTMSTVAFELNSSYYTTAIGNSALDGFSVIEPENATSALYILPAYIRTTSMVACIIVMILGIVGNLMVPLVVLRGKDMRNSTNIFLVNLSVADLCVLVICTPSVLIEVNSGPQVWLLGEHMCKAVPFVELTVAHASVLTILAISFERYYAICEPLRAGYVCTKARATFLCFLAWVAAAICTSPMIWVSQYREMRMTSHSVAHDVVADVIERDPQMSSQVNRVPMCLTQADTITSVTFFLLLVLLFFVAPFVILVVLYAFIVSHLIRDTSTTPGGGGGTGDSYHSRARRQVVYMLLTVVVSFFVCLSPYWLLILYIVITPAERIATIDYDTFLCLLNFSRIMFYLNSASNPILYNLMSSKFRRGFLKLCGFGNEGITHRSTVNGVMRRVAINRQDQNQEENFL
ncbi:growth hormone secretagogue receptor type 1 isoform X2 [Pogonomyrmex barbatus]|uniref:Growth hormone secretagogue receptor type 1 isoform X2 n=1 Tax=Pogonomyrmex barbatus TaxID=144034 RepID=A0A6I9WGD2_9HYME|nr:growth hormone secretagogue receptor type 1 isoform X2 [Pogonomyrmex barbatus]